MQTEYMNVTGMTCGGCTSKVSRALKSVAGVGDVDVSLAAGATTVQYDEHVTSSEELKSAVRSAGYGVDVVLATKVKQSKGGCCCG